MYMLITVVFTSEAQFRNKEKKQFTIDDCVMLNDSKYS